MAMWPSCWKWATGHFGALTGRWVKLGLPSRLSWVSRYEKLRPCSRGSLLKSMPGTTFWVQKATCSVSAKKLSTVRSSTSRPIAPHRHQLLGDDLGGVEDVEVERVGEVVVEQLDAELPLREVTAVDGVPGHRGEAHEYRCRLAGPLEQVRPREVAQRLVRLEVAVGTEAAGVDDPLGDALVVEVEDLLAEMEVLEQRRSASAALSVFWSSATGIPCWVVNRGRSPPANWCVSPPARVSSIRSAAVAVSGAA